MASMVERKSWNRAGFLIKTMEEGMSNSRSNKKPKSHISERA